VILPGENYTAIQGIFYDSKENFDSTTADTLSINLL
jgi:hypothetical protein